MHKILHPHKKAKEKADRAFLHQMAKAGAGKGGKGGGERERGGNGGSYKS